MRSFLLRMALGHKLGSHPHLRGVNLVQLLQALWWAAGITPTSRLRARRLRESIADDRGLSVSFSIARASAA